MVCSPYGSHMILVFRDVRFIPKFEGSHPARECWMRVGWVRIGDFWSLSRRISETVQDATKVTINQMITNRKSNTRFQLVPKSATLVRPPGTAVPDGLMFYRRCIFFFLFRHSFSELLKLCHMVGIWMNFIIPLQKLGGALPQKNLGAKNMQNFCQFWTTSDFVREYLRNVWRYSKSENSTNYGNSSCV